MLRLGPARDYPRAMRTALAILLLAVVPGTGAADEHLLSIDELLAVPQAAAKRLFTIDELVALSVEGDMRRAFDEAAMAMYHPDCRCLVYFQKGEVRKTELPLDDSTRRVLIEDIKQGHIIPIIRKGRGI